MNIRVISCVLALAVSALAAPARAQSASPAGLWLTQDRGGVIDIARCGRGLCARIAGVVLDHPSDAVPVDYQGVSQCGLTLINNARQVQPDLWKGHILDPRDGKVYGVELRLDDRGELKLRGYLGIPLLGRTETWTRFDGTVPDDCRLIPGQTNIARGHQDVGPSG